MKVLSVNVGLPRLVEYGGEPILTSIFKEPVKGSVHVGEVNLDGDRQSDLRVHGGYYKAVYVYPSEHYEYWKRELPEITYSDGMFGENLTTEGLLESDVRVGDRLKIRTAQFIVTQPRSPCFKLNIRFNRTDMIKRFVRAGRSGFYLAIAVQGHIEAGNSIEIEQTAVGAETIENVARRMFRVK